MQQKRVVVIGAGLAGLATSIVLAEHGFPVTLLERRPFLGGRATSYPVPQQVEAPEEYVDNCQHVLMRCCTNLIDFYRRLGVLDAIRFDDRFAFLDEHGRLSVLRGSILPAPFHFLPSFLFFRLLSWKDRRLVGTAMLRILRQQHRLEELDRITMREWLEQQGQSPRSIEVFWRTVLVSALNEDLEKASARYGCKVFLDGFLNHNKAFEMGVPSVDLGRLYTEPCLKFLESRGGQVRLRCTVAGMEMNGEGVECLRLADGERISGDYIIATTPPDVLLKLLPEETIDRFEYFKLWKQFDQSPITAIYFWFDREFTQLPHVAFPGRPIQWLFNKGGGHVGLVVSASRDLLQMGRPEILDIAYRELCKAMPEAAQVKLMRSVVIKEPYATFSCSPGADAIRPDQKSPIRNLHVAGDWTRTGWPPTMEGAVRSGYRCAELILEAEGIGKEVLVPDFPVQFLPKLLGK